MAPFINAVQFSQGYKGTSPQELLVLIWSMSEGWKAGLTLDQLSGFELRLLDWKSSTINTTIIRKIYVGCKWPVFINIKLCTISSNRVIIVRETFIFYALLPISLLDKGFAVAFLNRFFFIWGLSQSAAEGRVRQVVISYHKDCMRIGLGRRSIGLIRQMVVL